jgi:hypothetical protein
VLTLRRANHLLCLFVHPWFFASCNGILVGAVHVPTSCWYIDISLWDWTGDTAISCHGAVISHRSEAKWARPATLSQQPELWLHYKAELLPSSPQQPLRSYQLIPRTEFKFCTACRPL